MGSRWGFGRGREALRTKVTELKMPFLANYEAGAGPTRFPAGRVRGWDQRVVVPGGGRHQADDPVGARVRPSRCLTI